MTGSLLPPNASLAELALEGATARIGDVPTPLRDLWNPQTCPEALLPWLASMLGIDAWKSYWPVEVKRARVAAAIAIQRHKGTVKSVRDVIAAYGGAVVLQEWWQQQPPGVPHMFAMTLTLSGQDGQQATAQYVDDVIADVNRTKPVRSHYTFTQGSAFSTSIGVAVVVRACIYVQLSFQAP
ncbi:MAG TPA: phage tail protein I [Rhodanobacter sp.]|nr:phage tail protein I [Rhodanobacter sp.]